MAVAELGGKTLEVDEDGFIQNIGAWDRSVAADLARSEGVAELTEKHWIVVNFLREYYLKNKIAPLVRKLCKETHLKLQEIYELFPTGPAQGACKIAGLPKPTGCV
jgi:dissimilatory sulfite reductase related protein